MADRLNRASQASLFVGNSLVSENGFFTLVLQADGNLVLYDPTGPRWASNTFNRPDRAPIFRATVLEDGNFEVATRVTGRVWSAGVANYSGCESATLVVQNDGNLVLYAPGGRAVWHTVTGINVFQEGAVFQAPDDPKVYVVQNRQRHHIPDPLTLEQRHGGWAAVRRIPADLLAQVPLGDAVPAVQPSVEPDYRVDMNNAGIVLVVSSRGTKELVDGMNDLAAKQDLVVKGLQATGSQVTDAIMAAIKLIALFLQVSAHVVRAMDQGRGVFLTVPWAGLIFSQIFVIPTPR